jgi:hypothetical protein
MVVRPGFSSDLRLKRTGSNIGWSITRSFFAASTRLEPRFARVRESHYEKCDDTRLTQRWSRRRAARLNAGTMSPGTNAVPITSASMDITPGKPAPEGRNSTEGIPPIFKVRFEADGKVFEGTIQNPVAGNRRITGTWTRGSERGTFQIRRL